MALLTLSVAAVSLAGSTLLVTGSSRVEPVEVEPESIVCQGIGSPYQRTLPAGAHCSPRIEVEVAPAP
jgi:hypothetical protein